MKKIIGLLKKNVNNQRGDVSGLAVAGGLLLFALLAMAALVLALNPELDASYNTITTAVRNTFTTIGGI